MTAEIPVWVYSIIRGVYFSTSVEISMLVSSRRLIIHIIMMPTFLSTKTNNVQYIIRVFAGNGHPARCQE